MSQSGLSRFETGNASLSLEAFVAACVALGLNAHVELVCASVRTDVGA